MKFVVLLFVCALAVVAAAEVKGTTKDIKQDAFAMKLPSLSEYQAAHASWVSLMNNLHIAVPEEALRQPTQADFNLAILKAKGALSFIPTEQQVEPKEEMSVKLGAERSEILTVEPVRKVQKQTTLKTTKATPSSFHMRLPTLSEYQSAHNAWVSMMNNLHIAVPQEALAMPTQKDFDLALNRAKSALSFNAAMLNATAIENEESEFSAQNVAVMYDSLLPSVRLGLGLPAVSFSAAPFSYAMAPSISYALSALTVPSINYATTLGYTTGLPLTTTYSSFPTAFTTALPVATRVSTIASTIPLASSSYALNACPAINYGFGLPAVNLGFKLFL